MSTDAISPLRQRMIEDMSARQLHPVTQKGHIRACKRFAAFLKRSPDTATSDDLGRFQLHPTERPSEVLRQRRGTRGQWHTFLSDPATSGQSHAFSAPCPRAARFQPRRKQSACSAP